MIHVRFQPAKDAPIVDVTIDERKHSIESVLQRAAERVFSGPFDPMEEAGSEARFQAVMRERKARSAKARRK